jgi:hypothetical protein
MLTLPSSKDTDISFIYKNDDYFLYMDSVLRSLLGYYNRCLGSSLCIIVFKENASGSICVGIPERIRAFVDAAIKVNN